MTVLGLVAGLWAELLGGGETPRVTGRQAAPVYQRDPSGLFLRDTDDAACAERGCAARFNDEKPLAPEPEGQKRGARELLLPARTPLPLAQDPHAHAKLPALGQSSPPRKKAGQRGGSVITAHSDKGAEASPASPP